MKLFSVLTRKSIDSRVKVEAELFCNLLTNNGWFLKTNALLGIEYVGHTCKEANKLLYIPTESMEVVIPCKTPAPSEEVISWANKLLLSVDMAPSPINRSIVYSIFGYQSPVVPRFIIVTDKRISKLVSKVLKANNAEHIQILLKLCPSQLKELVVINGS